MLLTKRSFGQFSSSLGRPRAGQAAADTPLAVGGNNPGDGLPDGGGMAVPSPGEPTAAVPPLKQPPAPPQPPPAQTVPGQPPVAAAPPAPPAPATPPGPPAPVPPAPVPPMPPPPLPKTAASPLVEAFVARCRAANLTDEQFRAAVEKAAAAHPLLAEEFEKTAIIPFLAPALMGAARFIGGRLLSGGLGRGLTAIGSRIGGAGNAVGRGLTAAGGKVDQAGKFLVNKGTPVSTAATRHPGLLNTVPSGTLPAAAPGKATADLVARPTVAGKLPDDLAANKVLAARNEESRAMADRMSSMTVSGPKPVAAATGAEAAATRPGWFGRYSNALTMGGMIGVPMGIEGVAAGRQAGRDRQATAEAVQLASAASAGAPADVTTFAQTHALSPTAAGALTHVMQFPELRAKLTDFNEAGRFVAGLKQLAAQPGMTPERLQEMAVNQLVPGGAMNFPPEGATTKAGVWTPRFLRDAVMAKRKAALESQRLSREVPSQYVTPQEPPVTIRDAVGAAGDLIARPFRAGFKKLTDELDRSATAKRPTPPYNIAPLPPDPITLGERARAALRLSGSAAIAAPKYVKDLAVAHPRAAIGATALAAGATPLLLGEPSAPAAAFEAGTPKAAVALIGQPGLLDGANDLLKIRSQGPALLDRAGTALSDAGDWAGRTATDVGQGAGNLLTRVGQGVSDVWGGLQPHHKALLIGGGGLLANSLLKNTAGYGFDLGLPGLLAGVGAAGYGLSGGSLGGLADNAKKLVGMGQQPAAAPTSTPVAPAAAGGTAPAAPPAGVTLEQASGHPQLSRYFSNGKPNFRAVVAAKDDDLLEGLKLLHPTARQQLREQVAAYKPNWAERMMGAEAHRTRFGDLLTKVGAAKLERLVKAAALISFEDLRPPQLATGERLDRGVPAERPVERPAARPGERKRGPASEYCPHCAARLERGDDGACNRCGEDWPEERVKKA